MITCNLIVHKGPPCTRIRLQPYRSYDHPYEGGPLELVTLDFFCNRAQNRFCKWLEAIKLNFRLTAQI